MAYMNQELKKQRAPQIKKVLKKYGLKGTIGVRNYSTLYVTIKEGALDFIGAAQKINDEYARRHFQKAHQITDGYLQVNENRGDDYREYDKKFTEANFPRCNGCDINDGIDCCEKQEKNQQEQKEPINKLYS